MLSSGLVKDKSVSSDQNSSSVPVITIKTITGKQLANSFNEAPDQQTQTLRKAASSTTVYFTQQKNQL